MVLKKVALTSIEAFKKYTYNFGPTHPLRPLRLFLTYSLFEQLGLLDSKVLSIIPTRFCTEEELQRTHSSDYIDVVKKLSANPNDRTINPTRYGLGPGDNPIFEGMYEASSLVCGASCSAAAALWKDEDIKIAFNPSGGLHHALKDKASGFCIFNDIAVAIHYLKSLKNDIRIAYVDIDCHHGDGVQWLFYDDPNVLTVSFHQDGRFLFPGTGSVREIGEGLGEGFSINFPLNPGTNNKMFLKLFRATVPKILELYKPDLLFTQLGVDTHYNDPLTQMGASISLYRDLAQTMKTSAKEFCNNKWLAVGGGGYLMSVVPRAWSIFLANMLDEELENKLPDDWIQEVKEEVPYEDTPYLLWDRDDRPEVQLLSHPELAKKMIEYNKSLIKHNEEVYLPLLEKKLN